MTKYFFNTVVHTTTGKSTIFERKSGFISAKDYESVIDRVLAQYCTQLTNTITCHSITIREGSCDGKIIYQGPTALKDYLPMKEVKGMLPGPRHDLTINDILSFATETTFYRGYFDTFKPENITDPKELVK